MEEEYIEGNLENFVVSEVAYMTNLTYKFTHRKPYIPKNIKKVTAFLPGTVQKVSVKQGHKVHKGDLLLTFEAMKMINDVIAPMDAVIQKINVKDGEILTKDQILIELKKYTFGKKKKELPE